jgi:hypothetical protein
MLKRQILSLMLAVSATTALGGQVNVLTWHNNNWRDGLNSSETILNQSNVTAAQFGKLCSAVVDGQVYGQPLVTSVAGQNIVYIVTQNDSAYSINGANCSIINTVSLLKSGEEPAQCTDVGGGKCQTIAPTIGILGTPVVDPSTNTIYLVSESELTTGSCAVTGRKKPTSCFLHRVHALDLTTLAEKFNGPVQIAGSYQSLKFGSYNHIQRAGLLWLSGAMPNGDNGIYLGFSEMDGGGTAGKSIPSGWVFGYDAQNLAAAPYVWSSTPDGEGGGVWGSGAGLAAGYDSPGGSSYIYFTTGDGDFTANTGGSDYGDSFVKLTTALDVAAYFTPYAQGCWNPEDLDFGSSGVMLIPPSGSEYYGVVGSKSGEVFGINLADPSGYTAPTNSSCPATGINPGVENFQGSPHQMYTTAVTWDSQLFFIPMYEPMSKYKLNVNGDCFNTPVCTNGVLKTAVSFEYGTNLSLSSSGTTTGTAIVWATAGNGYPAAAAAPYVFYAFDAQHSVSNKIPELWNNTNCPNRDAVGNANKFVVPTIANGIVYVGSMDPTDSTNTRGRLDVFGLTSVPCS